MASVTVVGPHRLDAEPPSLFVFKLPTGRKKIPRRSSVEKMVFRRSSATGDCGSPRTEAINGSSTPEKPLTQRMSPAAAAPGDTAVPRGGMAGEGCGALPAPPPRSPGQGTGGSPTGDWNSNTDRDLNQNPGGWRGASVKRTVIGANGHCRGTQPHRDPANGRRAPQHHITSPGPLSPGAPELPLERLTQGKTGVVRLARTEPPRREAWAIFALERDPRVRTERGVGHRFGSRTVTQDWCDVCSRQITVQALQCQNCSYTCHLECESRVQLDCNQKDKKSERTPSPRNHCSTAPQHKNEAKEEEEGGTKALALSNEEVQSRIEEYNAKVTEKGMKLTSNGSYTGFIHVHLRLSRPVTVPTLEATVPEGGSKPTDRHSQPVTTSEAQEGQDSGLSDKRTSFYLPSDSISQIHITSSTTASEVIQALLKKYMVLDNPRKFALYRQTHRDGQDLFQKLPLCERPLYLRLITGPDPQQLSFVLKENETGEVEWHAFSVPELQNFLAILEKEEAERIRVVEQRYAAYRQKLQQALRQHDR